MHTEKNCRRETETTRNEKPPPVPIPLVAHRLVKNKKRRSRNGCKTCKRRKVKCDEIKPNCGPCARFGLSCGDNSSVDFIVSRAFTTDPMAMLSSTIIPSYSILGDQVQEPLLRVFFEDVSRDMFRSVTAAVNPYVTAILPLIHDSPTVLHAAQALAALYSASAVTNNPSSASGVDTMARTRVDGMQHQLKAIQLLANDLKDPEKSRSDAVLASTLLLCMCEETLDADVTHPLSYLEGARQLIRNRFFDDSKIAVSQQKQVTWSTRLLIKLFIWHDMLTLFALPLSSYCASWSLDILRLTDILNQIGDTNPFLFGAARDVFWLMAEVTEFTRGLQTLSRNESDFLWQLDVLPKALQLEQRLKKYDIYRSSLRLYTGSESPSDADLKECLLTVDVYRRSSLLYLYQMMPDMLPEFLVDELAHDILSAVYAIPRTSPSLAFHGWILVTAGSHCQDQVDRLRVLEQLDFMQSRFRSGSSAKNAGRFISEVWRRRDEARDRGENLREVRWHWTSIMRDLGWGLMLV